MKEYDIIVIGSGCGVSVAYEAMEHGWKTALIDKGPTGGTCLNVGCVPSKMLIAPADRIVDIQESSKLGIKARIEDIDFGFIMRHMRKAVAENRQSIRRELLANTKLDFYDGEAHFTSDRVLDFQGKRLRARTIVIASGSRPAIPPIAGLEKVDYLTNETLLELKAKPESLIIIGGGYVAAEYGHFFAAMGTGVTIVEMGDRLVPGEEPDISELLRQALSRRLNVYVNTKAIAVKSYKNSLSLKVQDIKSGAEQELKAEKILVAAGRSSNADWLKPQNSGVKLDERGYIKVNPYLRTNKRNVFAIGDANGIQMFTHVANKEAEIVATNILHGSRIKMDYSAIPHAIFTHPQIAAVGLTEAQAQKTHKLLVGRARYFDAAGGEAMAETEGFTKAIINQDDGKILGFHIIGPYASILIQEVINAMTSQQNIDGIQSRLHIHPALPELIQKTLSNLEGPASKM